MGFSQEMKDFVSAWQSTSKMNSDAAYKDALTAASKGQEARASDPDTLELAQKQGEATLAGTQARTSATLQGIKLAQRRLAIQEQLAKGQLDTGTGNLPPGMVGPAAGSAPAALPPSSLQTEAYADGGLVPEEDDTEDPGAAVGEGSSDATDMSAARRGGGLAPQLIDDGHSAVQAGYGYLHRTLGLGTGGIKTAAQKRAALALQQGAMGLSQQEMEAARKAVDPNNELTDSQRNMAALGSVYQFWRNKGEPQKAERIAAQMMQHYRSASERYAAIAAHAAQGGDMPLAAKAAVMAYANVPDGKDFHIEASPDDPKRLVYYYTDDKGNEIAKGIVTPQELASSAMGLASGGFDKALLTAAGQREEAVKGKGPKGATISDRKNIQGMIDDPNSPVSKAFEADKAAKEKAGQAPDEEHWGSLKDATSHILQDNDHATVHSAFNAAQELLRVNPDDKNPKMPFKVTSSEEGDEHVISFKNGLKAKLNTDQLNEVINKRAAALKASDESIDQEADAEGEPGWFSRRVAPVGSAVGSAVGDAAAAPATERPVFPGGASGAVGSDEAVAVAPRTERPYIPVLANRRRSTGAIPD